MTIRWGIIGCGAVTEIKSGPALQQAPDSRLVLVQRRTPELAADYARRHGVPRWTTEAAAVLRDPEVDAVYIATPPGAHAELALAAAAAGKPAYVEKPMARHAAECERMLAAFHRAGRPLFVAYYRRALPYFLEARALLAAGALGRLHSVSVRYASDACLRVPPDTLPWRLRAEESGGGLFMDLACHTLDLLDWLLGPLEEVCGAATRQPAAPYAVEDSVTMSFRIGVVRGDAVWDFTAADRQDEIVLRGAQGTLRLATFGSMTLLLETARGVERIARPPPPAIQQPLVTSIVDELHGRGRCPSTGASALRTARVMDAALAGFYGGRADAFWTRGVTADTRRDPGTADPRWV
ncbi:MAG: Gfo/Idh/MocA family oxidoreductase [Kiritimatiellaeota bacterium]|nr:Gfo/Idh/MocA family oxidoreductase [Kiritimatiellota bacterium]